VAELDVTTCGLEIRPIFKDFATGDIFPVVLRELSRGLTNAIRRALYNFSREQTSFQPPHFHAIGRRAVVKAVRDVDRLLADAADQYDFLLQVTPTNSLEAWHEFRRNKYDKRPIFHYRPLPADPVGLKRMVYRAPVEKIEDPALEMLFKEKE